MKKVEIEKALAYGWKTTLANFWMFAFLLIALVFFTLIFASFTQSLEKSFLFYPLGVLFSIVAGGFISAYLVRALLNTYKDKKVHLRGVQEVFPKLIRFIFASIAYSAIVMVGFCLFIIPGIIFAIKFMYVPFLIVDKDMSFSEAFKTSNELASGVQWFLMAYLIISYFIILLGVLCFGIGLFFAVPTVWMSGVYIYKHLLENTSDVEINNLKNEISVLEKTKAKTKIFFVSSFIIFLSAIFVGVGIIGILSFLCKITGGSSEECSAIAWLGFGTIPVGVFLFLVAMVYFFMGIFSWIKNKGNDK